MSDKMTCGRRRESLAYGYDAAGEDEWRADGTCSYCGSISPAEFFEAIEAGREIGPTDKSYKVYVRRPGFGKFYFQHLNEDEKKRFLELVNEGKVNFGYPGHLYTTPYFAKKGSA